MTGRELYRHRQTGTVLAWSVSLAALAAGAAVYRATGQPLGALAVASVLVLTNLLFSSLTVAVDPREVTIRFGAGAIRKTFRVEDIAGARAVRNAWWYGWGIRLTPHGWLYNVGGLDAVELEMRNRRKVRIGTDEPDRLLAALRQVIP